MEVRRKLVDDAGTPAMDTLPLKNFSPNPPVQKDHLAVDGEGGTMAGLVNLAFQAA
jgi:hypothetical protein